MVRNNAQPRDKEAAQIEPSAAVTALQWCWQTQAIRRGTCTLELLTAAAFGQLHATGLRACSELCFLTMFNIHEVWTDTYNLSRHCQE